MENGKLKNKMLGILIERRPVAAKEGMLDRGTTLYGFMWGFE